jgi:N-acetylmuramoyl-L-alanine amidase
MRGKTGFHPVSTEFFCCLPAMLALLGTLAAPVAVARTVLEDPLPFGEIRRALTLAYIRAHYDEAAEDVAISPRMVVIHWTASATLRSALATFRPEVLAPGRPEIGKAGRLNVSAHYLVDRDGTIVRLLPEDRMARHVIGLNRVAIGIENVGGPRQPLTEAQVEANAWLVRELKARHPQLRYLIGHHEYGRFRGTPLWEEKDPSYFTRKQDPGKEYMERLRAELSDLALLDSWQAEDPAAP